MQAQNALPLAAVIVVGWNSKKDLSECLTSLLNQDYVNFKVVFVDNNSADGSFDFVAEKFPQVVALQTGQNLYFTGGHNYGMTYALQKLKADFVAIINPDTIASANWLSSQIKFLQSHPDAGIVGCKVHFATGFGPNASLLSTDSTKIINTAGLLPGGFLFPYDRGFGEIDQGQFAIVEQVYAVSGVSMIMPATVLQQLGGFFTPMRMYLEDVDFCLRVKKAGWQVYYFPETTVAHKWMQSTSQAGKQRYKFWSSRNYLVLLVRHYSLKKVLRGLWELLKQHGLLFSGRAALSAFWLLLGVRLGAGQNS